MSLKRFHGSLHANNDRYWLVFGPNQIIFMCFIAIQFETITIVGLDRETLVRIIYSYNVLSGRVEKVVRRNTRRNPIGWNDVTRKMCVCVCMFEKKENKRKYIVL